MMCCSSRAAVYFLSSIQLYFAITQVLIPTTPFVYQHFATNSTICFMTSIFCIAYFTSAILIFLGADKESSTLLRYGGQLLSVSLIYRFFILGFSLLINEVLPEVKPFYVYNTQVVPIIFLCIIYIFYLSVVFCYHNELVDEHLRSIRASDHLSGLYLYKYPGSSSINRFQHQAASSAIASIGVGVSPLQLRSNPMICSTSFYEE